MEGLTESSRYYRSQAEVYKRFAECEDAPGRIVKLLRPAVRGKDVLDLGCGTGKYLGLFAPEARSYAGLDQAAPALAYAAAKARELPNTRCLLGSGEEIPLPRNSVDLVFASWVLGTVLDEERRAGILRECRRVLRPHGLIVLVENDYGGEFELIRGRTGADERTARYNSWLIKAGLTRSYATTTYFQFSSLEEAREIIGAIWSPKAAALVRGAVIEHRIAVFVAD